MCQSARISSLNRYDERGQPHRNLLSKGWDVLLEAYLSEFTSDDDVELYMLTQPFSGDRAKVRRGRHHPC